MHEKNEWVAEKERLNSEILTGTTNIAQAIGTGAREKLDLTRNKDFELE